MKGKSLPLITFEHKRDAYGFAVRPQHLQRYREYANIYKEEEEERSDRWKDFLERQAEASRIPSEDSSGEDIKITPSHEEEGIPVENTDEIENGPEKENVEKEEKEHKLQIWAQIRPSLSSIDQMMSLRIKKRKKSSGGGSHLAPIEEAKQSEDSDDEFYDAEKIDPNQEVLSGGEGGNSDSNLNSNGESQEALHPWKEELECLVRGGLPMALRGELWQAFVSVGTRRVEGYYNSLLAREVNTKGNNVHVPVPLNDANSQPKVPNGVGSEKWKGQIEKDLPRTFPGHPALDEDGRNALRRLLTAYARHNPSVGYCQAMNFFAGLLLLLMPEENAFWTLTGIIDDYFDGYYSEEMIESQVDQLVLEELVRERFPKLVNHLDYLGVQVAWVTGPWFLSIYMNMLPWESVLRVWDVLLFDGNRVMLFRTALALMELYGPALVTTKDAGDAVTLLQSLAGSTFDSSQLVLTACMGYQTVNELKLQELRNKHRPSVLAAMEERSRGLRVFKDSKGLATKLYSFKRNPEPLVSEANSKEGLNDINGNRDALESDSPTIDCIVSGLEVDSEVDSLPDLQEQVTWLKVELCRLLEEKRAEELETALMEMVKQDNRRQLSAKVEQLEQEVSELRQALSDKQEQERAMLQVLMRVEQEQKVTEDARIYAEQDAAAQRYATHVLQEKYEETMALLAQMENRAVMAETMLEATLQYQSSQLKAAQPSSPSPRTPTQDLSPAQMTQDSSLAIPPRRISLLSRPFGLGWRDKNKGKPSNSEEPAEQKNTSDGEQSVQTPEKVMNGHQEAEKVELTDGK
ncbi:TBC1 domain family member 8B-like isoform X2 [Ananas comosus]|uniref:TBC1 domain family member 8B-like isoform X2 n=1 Tax=Ananas comosus TaxID=4615 RepID=A0A6P5G2X0_ANACO|nr:TBC1 domain family member 8B-like isoform X2 [Ananas comosus]